MTDAQVIKLNGKAWAISPSGARRELKVGDKVAADEMVLTDAGVQISLDLGALGEIVLEGQQDSPQLEALLQEFAYETLPPLTLPAANSSSSSSISSSSISTSSPAPSSLRSGSGLDKDGHNFVQLVRIAEIIEADGFTPLEVARIEELLRPLGMAYPDRSRVYEEEREYLQTPTHSEDINNAPVPVGSLPNLENWDIDKIKDLLIDLDKLFKDADGDELTYSITGLPPGLTFNPKTGEIEGELPKNASQGGSNGVYKVTITATDPGGKSAEQSFNWTIKNPPPEAKPDADSTLKSVIIEVGKDDPKNVLGNDRDPDGDEIKVVGVVKGDTKTDSTGGAGTEVQGEYGTLILYPDGSYQYTPNLNNDKVWALPENQLLEDVFTYTISDGEGGYDNATLTIELKGHTHRPPADIQSSVEVYEKGLPGGSDVEGEKHIGEGVIVISALDGLAQVTIGDKSYSPDDLLGLNEGDVLYEDANGKIVFDYFEPQYTTQLAGDADPRIVGGHIHYKYVLEKAQDHSGEGNDSSLKIELDLKVKDNQYNDGTNDYGSQETSTILVVTVYDDAPTAVNDEDTVYEDGVAANGNLLSNDKLGADSDGAKVSEIAFDGTNGSTNTDGDLEISGKYGTLVVKSNGDYTYRLNNDNAEVNALKEGETLSEVFDYTMQDGDDDKSSAQLTITINGNTDGAPSIVPKDKNGNDPADPADPSTVESVGHVTVHESGLSGGTKDGDVSKPHIAEGAIDISSPDGLESIVVGGTLISLEQLQALNSADSNTHIKINTPSGKITVTGFTPETSVGGVPTKGELVFTYELTTPQNNDKNQGKDLNTTETVELVVKDAGGDSSTGELIINIIDDAPLAMADIDTVTEGATLTVDAANGVLANDKSGADGWNTAGAVVGVAKGGDTNNSINTGVGTEIVGDFGTLILQADGSYTYKSNPDSVEDAGKQDVFTYTVRDADGDEATTTLTIDITNVSLAPTTTTTTVEESGLTGGSKEGEDKHKTSGTVTVPDGQEVVPSSGTTNHGSFTIDENGGYTYTLNETTCGDNTSDSFTYTTKDQYGNTVENTVTVTIVDDAPEAKNDTDTVAAGDYTPEEGNVITGEGTTSGTDGADVKGADGAKVSKIKNAAQSTSGIVPDNGDPVTIQGKYGKLTIKEDGSYSYQRDPGTPGGVDDVFEYTLTDGDNDDATATLTITITDATPELKDLSVTGDALTFYEKNLATGTSPDSELLIKGGSFTIDSGDGVKSLTVKDKGNNEVEIVANNELVEANKVIETPAGKLTITGYNKATGEVTYTYELTTTQEHDAQGADSTFDDIQLTLKDYDDQKATGKIQVTVVDDIPVVIEKENDVSLTVAEADFDTDDAKDFSVLFDINHGADGKAATEHTEYTLDVAADGASGLVDTLSGKEVILSLDDNGNIIGTADGQTVLEISINKATGEITLDQKRSVKHSQADTEEFDKDIINIAKAGVTLTATATDGDNDTTTKTLEIGDRFNFKDDGPSIELDGDENPLTVEDGIVKESYLSSGSEYSGATEEEITDATVVKKDLPIAFGTDGPGTLEFEKDTEGSPVLPDFPVLKSAGEELKYSFAGSPDDPDYTTIIAKTEGKDGEDGKEIFTIKLDIAEDGTPSYEFTLKGALDHPLKDDNTADDIVLPFEVIAKDGDGDLVKLGFNIKVEDDTPILQRDLTVDEDGEVSFSNADVKKSTVEVKNADKADEPDEDGNDVWVLTNGHGKVLVDDNGKITYVPNEDYRGKDSFEYEVEMAGGASYTSKVNIDVPPVSDKPLFADGNGKYPGDEESSLEVDEKGELKGEGANYNYRVETPEDEPVSLKLKLPQVKDGAGENGEDHSERLGAIILEVKDLNSIDEGDAVAADVVLKVGDKELKPKDGKITIVITATSGGETPKEGYHVKEDTDIVPEKNEEEGVYYLTEEEYQSITAHPAEDRHENFEVKVEVTSYEVDEHGKQAVIETVDDDDNPVSTPVEGATASQTITVDVQAVTDKVGIEFKEPPSDGDWAGDKATALEQGKPFAEFAKDDEDKKIDNKINITLNEDTSFNLTTLLKTGEAAKDEDGKDIIKGEFKDTDGSESRYLGFEGLPQGTIISIQRQDGNGDPIVDEDGNPVVDEYAIGKAVEVSPDKTIPKLPEFKLSNDEDAKNTSAIKLNDKGELPEIFITPPKDFSGDLSEVKVIIAAQDSDSDSEYQLGANGEPLVDGEGNQIPYEPKWETDEVILNLHVAPVAGDVKADPATGNEDQPINFLENVKVTDTSKPSTNPQENIGKDIGKEIITKVEFEILEGWREFGFAIPVDVEDKPTGGWKVIPAESSDPFADGTDTTITRDVADGGGKWTVTVSGDGKTVTISADGDVNEIPDANDLQEVLGNFVITPPAHSSKNGEFELKITSQDTAVVNGETLVSTVTKGDDPNDPVKLEVIVKPVAEKIAGKYEDGKWVPADNNEISDTDGNNTADLSMGGSHSYQTSGKEDDWFKLGLEKGADRDDHANFNLSTGWANEDGNWVFISSDPAVRGDKWSAVWEEVKNKVGVNEPGIWVDLTDKDMVGEDNVDVSGRSEETYALLTPYMTQNNDARHDDNNPHGNLGKILDGSVFTYHDGNKLHVLPFAGKPVKIPMQYLDTVEFKGPQNWSGVVKIKVQAHTVDQGEDAKDKAAEATSGESWLTNLIIEPRADKVTLKVDTPIKAFEDTEFGLNIIPTSSDKNETFDVTISGIPAGAKIEYWDSLTKEWKQTTADANDFSISIPSFDVDKQPKVTPPQDSNEPFDLTVKAESVDTLEYINTEGNKVVVEHKGGKVTTTVYDKDTGDIIGTPDEKDVVTNNTDELKIEVSVQGVPDEPTLIPADNVVYNEDSDGTKLDSEDPEVGEGNKKSQLEVKLSDLITTLESGEIGVNGTEANPQPDDSETITLKISGLPEDFELVNAGPEFGSGEDRYWVIAADDLNKVTIKLPPHFSGTVDFLAQPIVTENDNPSQKYFDEKNISFKVNPVVDSTLSEATTDLKEDTIGQLELSPVETGGDDDEYISQIRIKVSEVTEKGLTLFTDINGSTDALTIEGDYYVFNVAPGQKAPDVFVKGPANHSGEVKLDIDFKVTDPSQDAADKVGRVEDVTSDWITKEHTLTFAPITDKIDAKVNDVTSTVGDDNFSYNAGTKTAAIKGAGKVTVKVDVSQLADEAAGGKKDIDDSEQLTHIVIDGVPTGVTVEGALNTGEGQWLIEISGAKFNTETIAQDIVFVVTGHAGNATRSITITSYSKDNGAESYEKAVIDWNLEVEQSGKGEGELPTVALTDKQTPQKEDIEFSLSDQVGATLSGGDLSEYDITVTLRTSPDDKTEFKDADGNLLTRSEVIENRKPVVLWTKTAKVSTGDDANDTLADLLESIKVHAPEHANSNNLPEGKLPLDVTVAVHASGITKKDTFQPKVELKPDSDPTTVTVTAEPADEGQDITINIALENEADGTFSTVVGDKVIVSLGEPGLVGKLLNANGQELTPTEEGGNTYEVALVNGEPPQLIFRPDSNQPHQTGSLNISVSVTTQETHADTSLPAEGNASLVINPTNSGFSGAITAEGSELQGSSSDLIPLTFGQGSGLVDTNEFIDSAFVSGLPDGFTVWVGEPGSMASNAGDGTWIIPVAANAKDLPQISIKPPQNWAGSLDDLKLTVMSGHQGLKPTPTEIDFELTVNPAPDGVTFNPTLSFGNAGDKIALNLNASMKDPSAATGSKDKEDAYTERTKLTLTGFPDGQKVLFFIGESDEPIKVVSSEEEITDWNTPTAYFNGDTWTLTGLSQTDLQELFFLHGEGSKADIKVQGWTYEVDSDGAPYKQGDNILYSAGSAEENVNISISATVPTSGDDKFLWDGTAIDGFGGEDTVQLRFGDNLGAGDFAKLSNIEVIDMSGEASGKNTINGLRPEDVFNMTSENDQHILKILGDSNDEVTLALDAGWRTESDGSYYAFVGEKNDIKVELQIIID